VPAAAGAAGVAGGVGGGTASAKIALEMGTLAQRVEAFERATLLAELKLHHHHMTNTAKALGLERSHLYKKCQQLGIDLRAIRQTE
jgi:two-component system nitrogen regulation response regulator NtrX